MMPIHPFGLGFDIAAPGDEHAHPAQTAGRSLLVRACRALFTNLLHTDKLASALTVRGPSYAVLAPTTPWRCTVIDLAELQFHSAIWIAVHDRNKRLLLNLLRSDFQLSADDRQSLPISSREN